MPLFCSKCGQQNSPEANFCFRCGSEIKASGQESNKDETPAIFLNKKSKPKSFNLNSKQKFLGISLTMLLAVLGAAIVSNSLASDQSGINLSTAAESPAPDDDLVNDPPVYVEEEVAEDYSDDLADPGSFVWQRNLDMTGVGVWDERYPNEWVEDVGQQYLFLNEVGCLFYVFDENSSDKDLMRRAYQWLQQYAGVHIAGNVWILLDSSYGEKCTGPVTDQFGGYQLN